MGIGRIATIGALTLASLAGCIPSVKSIIDLPNESTKKKLDYRDYGVYVGTVAMENGQFRYGRVDVSFTRESNKREIIGLLDLRGSEGIESNPDSENRVNLLTGHLLKHLAITGGAKFKVYVLPEAKEIFEENKTIKNLIERGVYSPSHEWIYVKRGSETEKTLKEGNPADLLGKTPTTKKFIAPRIVSGLELKFDPFEKKTN